MLKSFIGLFAATCFVAGCTAPQQSARPQAATGQSAATAVASVDTAPANDDDDYETIFVPPPVGSHLGGGSVRVPKRHVAGNDETALLGNIRRLNAAAGSKDERRFVVAAVSQVTGVTPKELQAQQDFLQLRFGELCAINAIARGNSNKVREIASMKSGGTSWTEVAKANGMSVATVVQAAQKANELTVNSYTNAAERTKGGQRKLRDLGIPRPNVPPGG